MDVVDHALQHTNANGAVIAVENVLGTTAGTSIAKNFAAGQFPLRVTGGGATGTHVTTLVGGTFANTTLIGTPQITGGTFSTGIIATGTLNTSVANSPKVGTSILDTNGGTMIAFTPTASAVNSFSLTNAITNTTPSFAAGGADTDISLQIKGKGAGRVIPQLNIGSVYLGTSTGVSSGPTDLGGGSLVITPAVASYIWIDAHFDISADTSGDVWAGIMSLNGTAQGIQTIFKAAQVNGRAVVSQSYILPLAASAGTIKMQGQRIAGSGTATYGLTHTGFTYFLISQ